MFINKARVLTPEFAIVAFDDARTGQLRSGARQRTRSRRHREFSASVREATDSWTLAKAEVGHGPKGQQQFGSNMGVLAKVRRMTVFKAAWILRALPF